ncbi:50S ribosome-binding GTPase [Vibrio europaeus]|uniref:GTPase family protein n=1 Tax=Vibrio europaeus TaxID=300876 RepID=UPI00233EA43E|nr:GTPase [Vibrio europaeus]MDC5806364.1 50S ribosome-binding GTPase [Vibrio europaeus]MDC5825792.1 50S ribosome-binding GTPase [Vibrio europaeus]MDC5830927.1 50S ribosome-binding GTPase [Vibrio europaeus]MDC5833882.1 50S ribosome-binding GTPase [Vibrio europaeus]
MKATKNLFRLLLDLSSGRWALLVISAVFPVLITMGFGVVLAVKHGYLLELSIAIAASSLSVMLPLYLLNSRRKKPVDDKASENLKRIDDGFVKASDDWSKAELTVWNESKHLVRQRLESDLEWGDLDKAALDVLDVVATRFYKESLDFSIPEGLKLFEEVSRRYKAVIKAHIPGVEHLKVSYIKAGYDAYEKYGELGQKLLKVAIWANRARQAYTNPMKVAIDIANEQTGRSLTKGLVDDMQLAAKTAFLDEVAAVAIDLYSGRFSIEESDIKASDVSQADEERLASELEPIRVVTVGQTSSGKSSLINVLKDELVAEVDVLPSTDSTTTYNAFVDENDVRVVDLQGLDGEEKTQQAMIEEMIQADVIVWVLKANQSARALDKQLKAKLDEFYLDPKNISRKKPKVISAVNQVDMLKPVNEWSPPYDIEAATCEKAKIIGQALDFNQKLLKPDVTLPLSIALDKPHFGVEGLQQALVDSIVEANNVQRNRQRVEAMERGVPISEQVGRAFNSTKKVISEVFR